MSLGCTKVLCVFPKNKDDFLCNHSVSDNIKINNLVLIPCNKSLVRINYSTILI